jgi:CRISPR-associated DxTHG motif protein
MKLLTFLGVGKYEQTTYTWQDQECTSQYSPVASCTFLNPDTLCVFLTEEAEKKVFPEFKQFLPTQLKVLTYPVPLGAREQELWKIFESVSGSVNFREEVAFDITHGLRSFPLIGLLVAAFLRAGMDVSIKAILYGAFDVGKIVSPGRTPMFDLTPMLSLFEWAVAADRFNRTGDSRYLSSLLKNQRKILALEAKENKALLSQIGHLGDLANLLSEISQSLQLIRPHQTMQRVAKLSELTQKAQPLLEHTAATRPFELLMGSVIQSYAPMAHTDPLNPLWK